MIEDFRKNAPAPLAPIPFDIPQPFETELANRLKVVIFEDSRLPIVSFRLAFRSGNIDDPTDSKGLTSAMTSMLTEGTKSYTSRQLAETIERLGASVSANSSHDNTIVAASALSLYTSDILRLMSEIVLYPTFPESELNLYKQNTIENLKFQRSQPGFLADEQMSRVIFGSHPYSVTAPTPDDIEKLTREKLASFHTQKFVANNAILIVVGDINRESILGEIEKTFGDCKKGTVEETKFDQPPNRANVTLTIVDRPGSAQSNIVLSNLAIERGHPDFFPVLVMNQILGSGGSSRLFMNLREEKGYTYGAYSSFDMRRQAGTFEATAEVRTVVTGDSLKEFFYELNKIRDENVSEVEQRDAKNFLTGVFPIRAETQEGLTNLIVSQKLYDLPADYLQTYREKISKVSIEDIDRVAKKYITPDKIAIVVVGDAEEILPQIQPFSANIEIFDTEGKPQDISNYGKQVSGETSDVGGDWSLTIDFQDQSLPVKLKLEQIEDKVSGSLESMLGKGEISDGNVKGNKFSATAKTQIQGQDVEITINGELENDTDSQSNQSSVSNKMKGTISIPMDGVSDLPFAGIKEN
ncbi:MAG TPA: pitrilysin family protein [Pyrinomonadaceae bacterium]|nr:pitrilysin family protein [Pyrinomonadaceae bacterium]